MCLPAGAASAQPLPFGTCLPVMLAPCLSMPRPSHFYPCPQPKTPTPRTVVLNPASPTPCLSLPRTCVPPSKPPPLHTPTPGQVDHHLPAILTPCLFLPRPYIPLSMPPTLQTAPPQVELTTSDWDECGTWLTALKRLIKVRQMAG